MAGCASSIVPCPGVLTRLPVSIEPADGATLPGQLRDALQVTVGCLHAQYDPVTEQGRWSYWVQLTNAPPPGSGLAYDFHLTHLERTVTNALDRAFSRDDGPVIGRQEFKLDALGADLHIPAGSLSFPCAETVSAPGRRSARIRSGVYSVHRRYTGDVRIAGPGPGQDRFVPVSVDFEVGFVTPDPDETLATYEERENAVRALEWVRVADRCQTCRPVIICESLGQPVPGPLERLPVAEPPPYHASNSSHVHVMAGVEKRPVVVDATLTERKRTVACTRWSPLGGTPGRPVVVETDSTEEGWPPATPYLTFHHAVPVAALSPGTWQIELILGEILEAAEDRGSGPSVEEQRVARARLLQAACAHGDVVFSQTLIIP
jgi:hypothetical protein